MEMKNLDKVLSMEPFARIKTEIYCLKPPSLYQQCDFTSKNII